MVVEGIIAKIYLPGVNIAPRSGKTAERNRPLRHAVFNASSGNWRIVMDKQRIEGGLKKATGAIKEKAGQITGNRDLEAEGTADRTEGKVRDAVGHVKDAVRNLTDKK